MLTMTLPSETEVLIAGAGRTGLALPTCLAGHGANCVLVDKLAAPLPTSCPAAGPSRSGAMDRSVAGSRCPTGIMNYPWSLLRPMKPRGDRINSLSAAARTLKVWANNLLTRPWACRRRELSDASE